MACQASRVGQLEWREAPSADLSGGMVEIRKLSQCWDDIFPDAECFGFRLKRKNLRDYLELSSLHIGN